MNYYQHHIGDFNNATLHLTEVEECMYHRALAWYYSNEKPLPLEKAQVYRYLRARSTALKNAVDNVLADFFFLEDDGYHQSRCDEEIAIYHGKAESASKAGKASAAKRAEKSSTTSKQQDNSNSTNDQRQFNERSTDVESTFNDNPTNQEPRTNNHNKTLSLIAGELEKSDLPKTPEHQTYGQALTPQQIIDLWQPDQELLAEHLKFALAQPVTLEFLNKILVKFNAQYEHQVLSENKKYSKLAGWIKDEQAKQANTRTGRTKTQSQKPDRVIHGSFGKIGESSTQIRDVSPVGVGYEHE